MNTIDCELLGAFIRQKFLVRLWLAHHESRIVVTTNVYNFLVISSCGRVNTLETDAIQTGERAHSICVWDQIEMFVFNFQQLIVLGGCNKPSFRKFDKIKANKPKKKKKIK